MSDATRFVAKIDGTDDPARCWTWTGYVLRGTYGQFRHHGKARFAHRVSYEMFIGPIPEGLDVDHLCHNKQCVNPNHLEAVTRGENLRRRRDYTAIRAGNAAGVCRRGHSPIVWTADRRCRECRREDKRRRHTRAHGGG